MATSLYFCAYLACNYVNTDKREQKLRKMKHTLYAQKFFRQILWLSIILH
jgi:hypothetical protein